MAQVTAGFKGDVGVVPRQFLRDFVTQMDLVEEHRGLRPGGTIRVHAQGVAPEEEQAIRGVAGNDRRRW